MGGPRSMADKAPSQQAQQLASQVERDGGRVLAVYQEPVGDHWQVFCLLPRERCEASPYQRDLSPTHGKRLTETVQRLDRLLDPILAGSPEPPAHSTPPPHPPLPLPPPLQPHPPPPL